MRGEEGKKEDKDDSHHGYAINGISSFHFTWSQLSDLILSLSSAVLQYLFWCVHSGVCGTNGYIIYLVSGPSTHANKVTLLS
jgi:hypothetical protein